jgi:hypothetical protein
MSLTVETPARIQKILDISGEDLVFTLGTIKAVPGVSIYSIENYSSPFDIEKQVYSFTTSVVYYKSFTITVGDTFTYTIGTRIYTFSVASFLEVEPNWIRLRVNHVSTTGG